MMPSNSGKYKLTNLNNYKAKVKELENQSLWNTSNKIILA